MSEDTLVLLCNNEIIVQNLILTSTLLVSVLFCKARQTVSTREARRVGNTLAVPTWKAKARVDRRLAVST